MGNPARPLRRLTHASHHLEPIAAEPAWLTPLGVPLTVTRLLMLGDGQDRPSYFGASHANSRQPGHRIRSV